MIIIAMLILAGIALFVFISPSHKTVSHQDLRDSSFLDDKEVLLYFSTSADQDAFGGGKSYALFISQDGSLSSFQMKGLELGSAKVHGENVMLEDKNTIYTIKDGLRSHKRAYQHTGDSAGFLQNTDGFYTLYNSGYDKKGDGYRSELYRQMNGEWKKTSSPTTSGPPVFMRVRFSHLSRQLTKRLSAPSDSSGSEEAHLPQHNGMAVQGRSLSRIPACRGRPSGLCYGSRSKSPQSLSNGQDQQKSGEVELHDIAEYKNDEQTIYSSMPFSFKNSFFPYDGNLYFIDGFGKVCKIDAKTGKTSIAFTLSRDKMKADFKEITQKGSSLYFFTYTYNKPAYIEQYSLKTGKKMKEKEIGKVKDVVTPKSHLKLYDVEVIKGF